MASKIKMSHFDHRKQEQNNTQKYFRIMYSDIIAVGLYKSWIFSINIISWSEVYGNQEKSSWHVKIWHTYALLLKLMNC